MHMLAVAGAALVDVAIFSACKGKVTLWRLHTWFEYSLHKAAHVYAQCTAGHYTDYMQEQWDGRQQPSPFM
jgi:hypothetical protein